MAIRSVTGELVVRYLDTWVPTALHARRATFVQAWSSKADAAAAEGVIRVFAEFGDHMRGRQITVIFLAPDLGDTPERLAEVRADLPADFAVHTVAGAVSSHLDAALSAARPAGAPLLLCVDGGPLGSLAGVAKGKPGEVLFLTTPDTVDTVTGAGFTMVNQVDLVGADETRRVVFATSAASHLEAYKNALWQLDEYAGVSIRDPHDRDAALLDISLTPSLVPLRREIETYLRAAGPQTVTAVRWFALADTVYRAADATKALTAMIANGSVLRSPEHGRLAGDTVVRAGG
jgi:hypothetical protein